jgi:hypothetical protein
MTSRLALTHQTMALPRDPASLTNHGSKEAYLTLKREAFPVPIIAARRGYCTQGSHHWNVNLQLCHRRRNRGHRFSQRVGISDGHSRKDNRTMRPDGHGQPEELGGVCLMCELVPYRQGGS